MLVTEDRSHKKSGQSSSGSLLPPGSSLARPLPPLSGTGPSVTLFLTVQDVLLGEGAEAPPFLPAWPFLASSAQACSRGPGCCPRAPWDAAEGAGGSGPCDHRTTSGAHTVPGEEGDGGGTQQIQNTTPQQIEGLGQGWWTTREGGGPMGVQGCESPNGLGSAVCTSPGLETGLQVRVQAGSKQTCEPAEILALSLATVGP